MKRTDPEEVVQVDQRVEEAPLVVLRKAELPEVELVSNLLLLSVHAEADHDGIVESVDQDEELKLSESAGMNDGARRPNRTLWASS